MSDSNYHLLSERRTEGLLSHSDEDHIAPLETNRSHTRVPDLDAFLIRIYSYFLGKGFANIVLSRFLYLLSLLWVFTLTTILVCYIDYDQLFSSYSLQKAYMYQGVHPVFVVCLFFFASFWIWEFLRFFRDIYHSYEIKQFYEKQLNIQSRDMQTIEWREVVQKLVKVPGLHYTKQQEPLTPLDIANRIMRKDNYMIAMINKDIFNLKVPLPFFPNRNMVTKTVEWSLAYTVFDFVFPTNTNSNSGISENFLDPNNSVYLAYTLRRRFTMIGLLTLFLSPFIFVFLVIYSFFRYAEEVKSAPTRFAARQWSPLAKWLFRELNELPHVFQRRLNQSYEPATKYVNSFPSQFVGTIASFLSFVLGSLLAILIIMGLIDDQSLFNVEIIEGRTAIWFLGVGGSLVAVCRGLIPDENQVIDPPKAMEDVVQQTHYLPKSWRNKVHTMNVYSQFTSLFDFKANLLFIELLSVLFTPFILLFSLPRSADRIVDFIRENTIKQEGVGYICKYAVFPIEETSELGISSMEASTRRRNKMKQGKVEKSFLNFKANHPEWKPSAAGEKYLNQITEVLSESQLPLHQSVYNRNAHSADESTFGLDQSNIFRDPHSMQESMAELNKIHRYFYRSSTGHTSDAKIL